MDQRFHNSFCYDRVNLGIGDPAFQNSFRYGRLGLGIGDIADEANFFIWGSKIFYINCEKFYKIKKVRFSEQLCWIAIGSRIPKQFSLWSGQLWYRRYPNDEANFFIWENKIFHINRKKFYEIKKDAVLWPIGLDIHWIKDFKTVFAMVGSALGSEI